jgi:FMN reductase
MKDWSPLVVGIGGTLRDGSTSERALRLALAEAARLGAKTQIFAGQSLNLPHYDTIERTERATSLVEALRTADGVIIATPSYHGSISGLVKNAIDYTEDLRADARAAILPDAPSAPSYARAEPKPWERRWGLCGPLFTRCAVGRLHFQR